MNIEEFNRRNQKLLTNSRIKECFYHNKDKCNGDIKQAHSIQNNRYLSLIAGEINGNKQLYVLSKFTSDDKNFISDLKPVGRKEASTFFGFCDYHDSILFSPIENNVFDEYSDEHLFLHSYRAFAHSYHKKKEEIKFYGKFPINSKNRFLKIKLIGDGYLLAKSALKEMEKCKSFLDNAIEKKEYDSLEYLVYRKEGLYPFAVSSQMSPKVTPKGKGINNHLNLNIPYENLMITVLPDENFTFIILATFPEQKKAMKLLDELEQLDDLNFERTITSLIIANCENTMFSPYFWDSLSEVQQEKFIKELRDNENDEYYKKFFRSSFNFFDDKYEMSNLKKKI